MKMNVGLIRPCWMTKKEAIATWKKFNAVTEQHRPIKVNRRTFLTNDDIETLLKNKKEGRKSYCVDHFKDDNSKVQFYAGLETLSVLMTIYNLVSPGLPNRGCLTKFQQLLLTLMHLNLLVQDLAYRFGIHASTVSRTFQACIQTMYSSMHFLVHWPDLNQNFPSCAVIMDCFEVFIDRPSDLLACAQTWSSYKHHNTAKFLCNRCVSNCFCTVNIVCSHSIVVSFYLGSIFSGNK